MRRTDTQALPARASLGFFTHCVFLQNLRAQTYHRASSGKMNSICANEVPCPFPREGNIKKAKIHRPHLDIFFCRTTGRFLTKYGTNHLSVKRIQVYSNHELIDNIVFYPISAIVRPYNCGVQTMEDNKENSENTLINIETFVLRVLWYNQIFVQIC